MSDETTQAIERANALLALQTHYKTAGGYRPTSKTVAINAHDLRLIVNRASVSCDDVAKIRAALEGIGL